MTTELETVDGETMALWEVLKLHAPCVKWTPALVANVMRGLAKRGYVVLPITYGARQ